MDAARWQRIKDLFEAARALPAPERARFLAGECGTDAGLRAELDSLLAADGVPEAILDRPAAAYLAPGALATETRWLGRRVGVYEIVAVLGRGGMGDVYRARRADGAFDKDVAVKLVRAGFDTGFVLERFAAERQILAGLTHPGIAQLLDGGATADGLPYLVMELVEGEPIDRYCDGRALGLAARLDLFREVCAAVSYAHQRLVVHRDLKPSNILVTGAGAVKLLDFGIAKLLSAGPGEPEGDATVTAFTALTPAYSSPEQLQGLPVTTASDVYSLGVVLYRLLTGRSPYGSRPTTTTAVLDSVLRGDALAPGAVIAAHGAPPGLPGRLDRDLDAIVLKALRKEPERRYASVEQMAEDVRRHLRRQPVR
ncbi:MAG: serine/threonine protein kinase, partial [Proteobacteria bacterium]|nr:serine/threonine protein kinase [Pseudomonadota bacterium]